MWKSVVVVAIVALLQQQQVVGAMVAESSTATAAHKPTTSTASWIAEDLWLGGVVDADDKSVAATVDCRFTFGAKFHDRKAKTWKSLERNMDTLQYLAYLIHSHRDENGMQHNNNDNNNQVLLVHCAMGRNRGPASLAAYLMLYQGMSLTKALSTIRSARPKSNTWDNTFIQELKQIAKLAAAAKGGKSAFVGRKRRRLSY